MVWKGSSPLTDCWGSLNTSVLTSVLPGDDGADAVRLQPTEAGQEDVKRGALLSPDILRSYVAMSGVTAAGVTVVKGWLLLWVHP